MSELIECLYYSSPDVLHHTIHIMRIGQQKIYDLTTEHQCTVIGIGMQFYPTSDDVPNSQCIIDVSPDGTTLALSYEVTNDPIDNQDYNQMRDLLDNLNRIDDDFDNASLEEIKKLDLSQLTSA